MLSEQVGRVGGGVRVVVGTTRAANEPFGMAEFCSPLFISFISEESQPRVRRRLCLAPHHSSRREIDVSPPPPPSPIHPPTPMLPSFLRPRSRPDVSVRTNKRPRRRNKKASMAFLQTRLRGFSRQRGRSLLVARLLGEGGRGGTSLAAEEATKQVDGVIYLFLSFLFLTEQSNNTAAGSATATVRGIQSTSKVLVGPMIPGSH